MAKGGRRYPLVVYTHMINRWWPAIFTLGTCLACLIMGASQLGI